MTNTNYLLMIIAVYGVVAVLIVTALILRITRAASRYWRDEWQEKSLVDDKPPTKNNSTTLIAF